MSFSYAEREVVIDRLSADPTPQRYDLCVPHAARTRPPQGWRMRDLRPDDERRPGDLPQPPADLGGDRTVAVLAAALRAVPDAVSEDAVAARPVAVVPVEVPQPAVLVAELAAAVGVPRPPLAVRRPAPVASW